eukprot:6073671-Pyramimonas_sp.AAC.1
MFDVFVLVQRNTAALVLGIYHSTNGARVPVEFALTKGATYALDALVNSALCTGHIDLINMCGREQVAARLETPRRWTRV